MPYWLRGSATWPTSPATLDRARLAQKWINGILATQASDGFFGPTQLRTSLDGGPDFWPHLPMVQALRSYSDYSGDSRMVRP